MSKLNADRLRAWVAESGGRGRSMDELIAEFGYVRGLSEVCRQAGVRTRDEGELAAERNAGKKGVRAAAKALKDNMKKTGHTRFYIDD